MNFSETEPNHILDWINDKNNGDDTYYLKGKQDTQEAIGVFRSLYDKEYEDVFQLFNYLRDSLKLRESDPKSKKKDIRFQSFYRAFISLYYNDDIINIRLSRHFSTEHSLKWAIDTKGEPDMEYHLVIDKEQSGNKKNVINKDTTYNGIKIKVMDIDLNEFNNETIDEIILLLTYGTTKRPSTNISVDSGGNYVAANGWGADYVSESRLRNIIRESIDTLLLTESQESKSISAAKKLVMQRLGYDEQQADKFVRMDLRQDLPTLRTPEGGKFILGVARMYCDNELTDANTIGNLNTTLKYVASEAHINEYDRNLNGMSVQDLIQRFAKNVEMDLENDRNEVGSMQFNDTSDYDIVRIDSFEQASEYGDYTSWCVTHDERMFDSYTHGGVNQFYFCLRNGFEQVPEEEGEGCPLDEYGLSMIAVCVNEHGGLNACTCRWNHDNGGNDNIMTTKEISEVIGMNFYKVFKPNNTWNELVETALDYFVNGYDLDYAFDEYYVCENGLMWVNLKGKENWVKQNGGLLSPNQWFDVCNDFRDGFAGVELNGKWNLINMNGELVLKKPNSMWFDGCNAFINGFSIVRKYRKFNYMNQNGDLLHGELHSPDKWFDDCEYFKKDGFARVKLNNEWYYIDKNGNLTEEKPQVTESYLRTIIRESIMNYINMDMINEQSSLV